MSLRIYNTITRRKEEFIPLKAGIVKMYVCGVTVYDYCHLGHGRAYVVWDMVRRYLQTKYQVTYVQNITDIDDKILKRSQERGTTMQAIADQYIATYNEDMAKLNIQPADAYPRATESIPEIVELIEQLIKGGYAYAAGGDVYYAVQKFPSYGKLSGRKLEDMQAGASGRVDDQEEYKRYPFDFALWKSAKPNEPFWASPWGDGRPGWHIECSAMVRSHLGETIDIHAGGADLQFPHHENEIAQSEAAYAKPLAKYWMHNGFVNIDGEKMSKSLHNFKTIRDLLGYFEPMAIRLFILQAQYRQPIDFTEEAIKAATKGWETIRDGMLFAKDFGNKLDWENIQTPSRDGILSSVKFVLKQCYVEERYNEHMNELNDFGTLSEYLGNASTAPLSELALPDRSEAILKTLDSSFRISNLIKLFEEAMDDDFNTSVALSYVFELAKKLRSERNSLLHSGKIYFSSELLYQEWQALSYMTNVLGFVATEVEHINNADDSKISDSEIEALIQQRREAKQSKNYGESDRLRNLLKAQGITLIDQKDGTTRWIRD
jgi:cysteinyl-tRNA synthetase